MNYTTITINDQKVGLKFGMPSFRYLSEKFKDGISYNDREINEFGISQIIYAGYYNNCLVKEILPEITFEQIVDFVESNFKNQDFMNDMQEVVRVWGESEFVKNSTAQNKEVDEISTAKKKTSRGKK